MTAAATQLGDRRHFGIRRKVGRELSPRDINVTNHLAATISCPLQVRTSSLLRCIGLFVGASIYVSISCTDLACS